VALEADPASRIRSSSLRRSTVPWHWPMASVTSAGESHLQMYQQNPTNLGGGHRKPWDGDVLGCLINDVQILGMVENIYLTYAVLVLFWRTMFCSWSGEHGQDEWPATNHSCADQLHRSLSSVWVACRQPRILPSGLPHSIGKWLLWGASTRWALDFHLHMANLRYAMMENPTSFLVA
jgi:hypothetical protein